MTDQPASDRRQLAAILAADVVGYSAKMEADERNTLKHLRELREGLLLPKVAEYRGRIFKTMGDGFLVEFASVVDAVHCAVDIQRAMAARNLDLPAEQQFLLRIGVNLGDVFHEGEDVFGDGVNIAARLEGLAEPGRICVSRAAHDQVREKLNFDFRDMGEHQVKNISRPIQVYRIQFEGDASPPAPTPTSALRGVSKRLLIPLVLLVLGAAAIGGAWKVGLLSSAPAKIEPWSAQDRRMSFAVLPLEAPKDDPGAQEYASMLTDELNITIGKQRYAGNVVARSEVEAALAARQKVNAAFLVEGKVRRVGDKFETRASVTATGSASVIGNETLLEAARGASHDPYRADLMSFVVKMFESAQAEETRRVRAMPEAARDARDLLILSWPLVRRSKSVLDQFVALREQALRLSPNEPNILAALGTALALRASGGWTDDKDGDLKRASEYLDRAAKADPENLYAMQGREMVYVARHNWNEALLQVRQILAINPAWVREVHTEAQTLLMLDRADEALEVFESQPIISGNLSSEWSHSLYGRIYFAQGKYKIAAERLRLAIVAGPPVSQEWGSMQYHLLLVAAEALQGNKAAAAEALAKFQVQAPTVKRQADVQWDEILLAPPALERVKAGLRLAGMPD